MGIVECDVTSVPERSRIPGGMQAHRSLMLLAGELSDGPQSFPANRFVVCGVWTWLFVVSNRHDRHDRHDRPPTRPLPSTNSTAPRLQIVSELIDAVGCIDILALQLAVVSV